MVRLFHTVFNLSLAGVPLILVVMLLRVLLAKRLPRRMFYLLWGLVLIRLLLPVSAVSPLSIYRWLGGETVSASPDSRVGSLDLWQGGEQTVELPAFRPPATAPTGGNEAHSGTEAPARPAAAQWKLEDAAAVVWACGTGVLMGYGVFCWAVTRQRLRFAVKQPCPQAKTAGERSGLRRLPSIWVSDQVESPIVCGILRPRVILPAGMDLGSGRALEHILTHEFTHLRRKDNLWRMLGAAAVAIHWFNPLVWAAFVLAVGDMEASCDEKVLLRGDGDIRREYAGLLVDLAARQQNVFSGGFLSFGESAVKERIRWIMNYRKTTAIVLGVCALALVLLSVLFLTNPGGGNGSSAGIIPEGEKEESSSQSSLPTQSESSQSQGLELLPEADGETGEEDDLPLSNEHINLSEVDRVYVQQAGSTTACLLDEEGQERLAQVINGMSLAWDTEPKEGADAADQVDTILVVGTNGESWQFLAGEQQVVGNGELLESTADQRAALRQLVDQFTREYPAHPQWLVALPLERLSQVEYHGYTSDGQTEITVDTDDFDGMWAAAEPLRELVCQPESWALTDNYALEEGSRWRLTFDTGEKYQIWMDKGRLVIHSSSRGQALEYAIDPDEGARLADQMEEIAHTIPGSIITLTVAE